MTYRLFEAFTRRSIMWLVGLAMLALTTIGLAGMSASVVVAETVQGSASAINEAGSLRRLTHRIASLLVADVMESRAESARVAEAVLQFEAGLRHPALLRVLEREPDSLFAATYRGAEATWQLSLKPRIESIRFDGPPPSAEAVPALLHEVDAFVEQLNTLVAVLEHDTERRIQDLRQILAVAIGLTLLLVTVVLIMLQRRVYRPLNALLQGAGRIAGGNFSSPVEHARRDELGQLASAINTMAGELSKLYRDLENRVEIRAPQTLNPKPWNPEPLNPPKTAQGV